MKRKRLKIVAISLLFLAASTVTLIHLSNARKINYIGTLPCQLVNGFGRVVETVVPSVMYGGRTYTWEKMSADSQRQLPEGYLPKDYSYAGDIQYVGTDTLSEDFQFNAVFDASGQLYSNPDTPDNVCIRITTYWLADSYVLFSAKNTKEE